MKRCILSVYSLDGELLGQFDSDAHFAGNRVRCVEFWYGQPQIVHLVYGEEIYSTQ